MRESVPTARYSPVCNVLRQWKTSLILTYRVYRLYDKYISAIIVLKGISLVYGEQHKKQTLSNNACETDAPRGITFSGCEN